ncbi:APC family permease [Pseudobacillus wudalianchiensis]|uniref:Putrescine importer PuuP n=1 Tax=Pseudobacillus wudalianchiensis TaxID=1743143 RepID=A0A1B9AYU0_9BACI|nr:APC family permease [Bacillus wudalianchiensis]OCA89117.1 Putrescine importer PuuP [Bacillus wudalianchiensis]
MNGSPALKRSLTLRHVILFGIAFMAPITVFTTYGIAIESTHGMIPVAYMIALMVMLFTAYSYGKMVQEFPITGSAYTFVQKGISPSLGFLVGWVILLDYLFSPMISALLFGIFVNAYLPAIPIGVCILSFIVIVTAINIFGIKIAANVNALLVFFQILFIVVFCILCFKGLLEEKGTGELFTSAPFFDPDVKFSNLLAVVPLLCFSFLGFDAITTLSEETKDPKRVMPKAIYGIVLIGGVLFVASTYFAQSIFPNFSAFKDPESAAVEIFMYAGGNFLNAFFLSVTVTAAIASAVASGGSGARILYAMGRENILPNKIFGHLSAKFQTPVYNILIIAVIAMSALFLSIETATSFINFGALFAFTFVNLSVFVHYFIRKKQRSIKGLLLYMLIPLMGAATTALFWTKLDIHSMTLGSIWLLIGFGYLLHLTKMFKQRPPELHFEETEYEM